MARHSMEITRPWFVRSRSRHGCQLSPASPAGWLLTGLYLLFAVGLSALLVGRGEPQAVEWTVWGMLLAGSTFAFLLTAWRTSEVRQTAGACTRRAGSSAEAAQALLVALVTALFIIGAALLGARI